MVFVIGEILIDVFPEYKRIGGAPFNFAFHLKRLGEDVRFITRIGQDAEGQDILRHLEQAQFCLQDIQIDNHHATGTVRVTVDPQGLPQFQILPDAAYDYIQLNRCLPLTGDVPIDMIYFGTLIQRTESGFRRVREFLAQKDQATKCFCDVNLRPNCYHKPVVENALRQAHILKLNAEELVSIQKMWASTESRPRFVYRLLRLHKIEMIALTKGDQGSALFTRVAQLKMSAPQIQSVVNTVGAGDAYAAILAIGYLHQWPLGRILSVASAFAGEICKIPGAIPDDDDFYNRFRSIIKSEQNEQR